MCKNNLFGLSMVLVLCLGLPLGPAHAQSCVQSDHIPLIVGMETIYRHSVTDEQRTCITEALEVVPTQPSVVAYHVVCSQPGHVYESWINTVGNQGLKYRSCNNGVCENLDPPSIDDIFPLCEGDSWNASEDWTVSVEECGITIELAGETFSGCCRMLYDGPSNNDHTFVKCPCMGIVTHSAAFASGTFELESYDLCAGVDDDTDDDGYVPTSCWESRLCGDDCNDSNPTINPGAQEICNDGIDNNCNGLIDCADPECNGDPACGHTASTIPTGMYRATDIGKSRLANYLGFYLIVPLIGLLFVRQFYCRRR